MLHHPVRALRNGPAAATVTARHLLRGTGHVAGIPQPWRSKPAYQRALDAYQAGDLHQAEELARKAGTPGRLLARLIAGEIALLDQPVAPAPVLRAASGPARVLHLVTNALPETVAGYTVRTQGIAAAQVAAGHDVHVLSRLGFPVNRGRLEASSEETVEGVPYHRLLGRLPLRADAALRLDVARSARLVRRLRPTVLHAHSNHVNGQVGLALRHQFGIPLVYEVRGFLEETWLSRTGGSPESDFYRLTRQAETRVMQAADAVVTLSASMREAIIGRGVQAERVHLVPNCVDTAWLDVPEVAAAPDLERTGPLTVGLGSTLNAYEGVDVLVEAVALLREQGADVRLVVLGSGPAAADLAELADRRGLGAAARFTGRVTRAELVEAYQGLDVFCLPRRDLPVTRLVPPLKPVEAMAMGIPVVASDLPPLRELLVGGGEDRGLLVRPDDPEALAEAVSTLTDAALRRRLGYAGRHWVRETRSWAAAATTYDAIYDELHLAHRGETA
ncbi:MAG: glycosyltransferase family 4 protein [Marmoricola sp.]